MKSRLLSLLLGLLLTACQHGGEHDSAPPPGELLFQVAPLQNLLGGGYGGVADFALVRRHGDLGLGTLEALDGEMIALEGRFYQIRADGKVHEIPPQATTPFAMVKTFTPDRTLPLAAGLDLTQVQAALDGAMGKPQHPWAIRLEGRFSRIKTRSVPRQTPPYPPLAQVVKAQSLFEFTDLEGSVVGFRLPDYLQGVNLPGYHFHFISARREVGGHLLALETANGVVAQLDQAEAFHLMLGVDGGSVQVVQPGELEKIEQDPAAYGRH